MTDVVNDSFHASPTHFSWILLRDCAKVTISDGLNSAAAAIDRDYQGILDPLAFNA